MESGRLGINLVSGMVFFISIDCFIGVWGSVLLHDFALINKAIIAVAPTIICETSSTQYLQFARLRS